MNTYRSNSKRWRLTYLMAGTLALPLLWSAPMRSQAGSVPVERAPDRVSFGESPFRCGYDPAGAENEWLNHRMNVIGSRERSMSDIGVGAGALNHSLQSKVTDIGDVSVLEDDGAIVIPPNKFDLKNRSLLFTPDGEGYQVKRGKLSFEESVGFELGYFFGVGNNLVEADNGFRPLSLHGAPFPFFGVSYDTIFVGTNGYVTFTRGDTGPAPSAAAFSSQLPRIAPLWSDLDASTRGSILFNELPGRYIITWQGVPQAEASGSNTFQVVLYEDGRIAFVYKKINCRSSLIGVSPGLPDREAEPIDLSRPPDISLSGPIFELFSNKKRLDIPALTQAFYRTHSDIFDFIYIWTDFQFDNGLGLAHSFNVRNDIRGIGLRTFDRGAIYGSAARLATIVTMGDNGDWPSDPDSNVAGLFSGISIACHELGHRWLAYVRFDADHDIKDDLLGRDANHWSFWVDTRSSEDGVSSSVMEGNAWRDNGNGIFTSIESTANYFSDLDQYLMGLRAPDEIGAINYLFVEDRSKTYLRTSSPAFNYSVGAVRKMTSVGQIVEREGPRVPDFSNSPRQFRAAFLLVTEQDAKVAAMPIESVDRYRRSLARYFSTATGRRASLDTSLVEEAR